MRHTEVAAVDPDRVGGVERRGLAATLGTDSVSANHYVVASGERISGLHAHVDQEEVFVVLEGAVAVETLDGTVDVAPGEAVRVAAGDAIRVAPGEFQSVTNPGDEPATVLALGAPRESSDLRVPVGCPDCGHGVAELAFTGDAARLVCPDCGHDRDAACPDCGGELRAELDDDGRPVSVCLACGGTWTER